MTFVRYGELQTYESIQECFKQENIDILYPSWLPNGAKIESVMVTNTQNGDIVYFQFNDDSIMLSVELYSTDLSVYINSTDYKLKTFNGIECWIESFEYNSYYNIIFIQDDCTYNMSIKNIEILPLVMEGLK